MPAASKFYQFPVSQPCRAIEWLNKLGNIPVESVFVNLFEGEHKTPAFLAKHPAGMLPMIETPCGVCAPESAAIMIYLCNTHGCTEYYPACEVARLKINSVLFAHDSMARVATTHVLYPCLRVLKTKPGATLCDVKQAVAEKLGELKEGLSKVEALLANRTYIADTDKPTIADLQVVCELNQIPLMPMLLPEEIVQFTAYPNIKKYMERMAQVPHHDEMLQPFQGFLARVPKA